MDSRRTAFEALFDESFERCEAAARRIVRDPALAEDLAAEAFARAWARWWWLRRQPAPVGWLVRVTTNLALDAVRRGPAPMGALAHPPTLEETVVLHNALVAALGALPDRQRAAVVLRYLADLPEAEVASAMGVSAGSVKTHLHRGLARLQSTLHLDEPELEAHLAPRP